MNIMDEGKEIVKFIKESSEKQLLDFFLELRETILKLRAENKALKEEISQREDEPAVGKVVQYGKLIYSASDSTHQKPYCLTCWAFDQKLVPLTLIDDGTGIQVKCKACAERG
jgi:hypothetical protein